MRRPGAAWRGRDVKLCLVAILVTAVFVELNLATPDLPWLRRLELVALDLRFRLRGPVPPGPEVAIVMIDDASLAALGRWPLPRRTFAALIDRLHRAGAKVVALDVLFAEPESALPEAAQELLAAAEALIDPRERALFAQQRRQVEESGDGLFAAAIRRAGNVVLPFTFRFGGGAVTPAPDYVARAAYAQQRAHEEYRPLRLRPTDMVPPIPALGEAAAGLGHSLVLFDVDGTPRYDYPAIEYDLDTYRSMAIAVAQLFLDVPPAAVRLELGRGIALGPVAVETDPAMRFGINYRGPSGTFPRYSFADVARGAVPDAAFRDRIVLVGSDVLGLGDAFGTPFTASLPGVERLATIVDSLLRGDALRRPAYAPGIETLAMIAAALAIGLVLARRTIAEATLAFLLLLVAGESAAQLAFSRAAMWYAGAVPGLALSLTFTTALLYRYGLLDKEHRRVRRELGRHLPPAMVERLALSPRPPELGGEQREVTIMFCDLRGFSGISERLDPQPLTRLVNDFLGTASAAVQAQGGTVDKYMGDAVMALWNAPLDQPDHAELACRAALDILARVGALNATRIAAGEAPLALGIGINSGLCTVGIFGSPGRHDYSALGDAVNIAARLESETKAFAVSILLGPDAASRVPGFATLPLDRIAVRGRRQEIEISALIGDERLARSDVFAGLRRRHAELRAAAAAGEPGRAADLARALAADAPADLVPLYQALAARFAERRGGARP
jgi:adenylate cyclase